MGWHITRRGGSPVVGSGPSHRCGGQEYKADLGGGGEVSSGQPGRLGDADCPGRAAERGRSSVGSHGLSTGSLTSGAGGVTWFCAVPCGHSPPQSIIWGGSHYMMSPLYRGCPALTLWEDSDTLY